MRFIGTVTGLSVGRLEELEYKYGYIQSGRVSFLMWRLKNRRGWSDQLRNGERVSFKSFDVNLGHVKLYKWLKLLTDGRNKKIPFEQVEEIEHEIRNLLVARSARGIAKQVSKIWDWTGMFETCGSGLETSYKPQTRDIFRLMTDPHLSSEFPGNAASLKDPVHGGSMLDWMLLAPWTEECGCRSDHKRYDDVVCELAARHDIASRHWASTILPKVSCLLCCCRTAVLVPEAAGSAKKLYKYLRWIQELGPAVLGRLVSQGLPSATSLCELPFKIWIGILAGHPGTMIRARKFARRQDTKDLENILSERYCVLFRYASFIRTLLLSKAGTKSNTVQIIIEYLVGEPLAKPPPRHSGQLPPVSDDAAWNPDVAEQAQWQQPEQAAVRDPELAQLQADADWADGVERSLSTWMPEAKPSQDSDEDKVVLLRFSRSPACLFQALESCPMLRECHQMLVDAGCSKQHPTGAKIFVHPWQFEPVTEALGSFNIKAGEIVAASEFEARIQQIAESLPKKHKVYFRGSESIELLETGSSSSSSEEIMLEKSLSDEIIVERTFITIKEKPSSLFSRSLGPKANSTTVAHCSNTRNPRLHKKKHECLRRWQKQLRTNAWPFSLSLSQVHQLTKRCRSEIRIVRASLILTAEFLVRQLIRCRDTHLF